MKTPITRGQRRVHIGAEIAGLVASPIGMYLAVTRVRNPAARLFFTTAAMSTFMVDLALLAQWGYKWRKGLL